MRKPAINDVTGEVIRTKQSTPAFREGWDRIFNKDKDMPNENSKETDKATETKSLVDTQPDHGARAHAAFSPSQLKYVKACSGYKGKDGTSPAAEMGTRIHEALEIFDPSSLHNENELAIYNDIVAMEEAFLEGYNYDKATWTELNEIRVNITLPNNETFGTCDRLLIHPDGKSAVMADYKTGISIIDPPENNYQAKAYVTGAFQRFPELERIVFVFYVPQHNYAPEHLFTRDDLPSLEAELDLIISKAAIVRPKWALGTPEIEDLNANQHCRFCRYEESCPALGGLVLSVAKQVAPEKSDGIPNANIDENTSPEELEALFDVAKILEKWAERVKKTVVEQAKAGTEFPSIRLRSMGSTKSVANAEYFLRIAEDYGINKDAILQNVNLPLAKLAKLASDPSAFLSACDEAGIIKISAERFTVR